MILHLNLNKLLIKELSNLGKSIKSSIAKINSEDGVFIKIKTKFLDRFDAYYSVANKENTKVLTEQVESDDKARDRITIGTLKYVKAFLYSDNSEQELAAVKILDIFKQFGASYYKESYETQSAYNEKIFVALAENQTEVDCLNLQPWIDMIKIRETSFQESFTARNNQSLNISDKSATEEKDLLIDSINQLFEYIDMMARYSEEASFNVFVEETNQILAKLSSQVKSRGTRNAAASEV